MLTQIEDSLIRRLREFLPESVEIGELPDTVTELSRPFESGQLLVYFAGLPGKSQPDTSGRFETRKTLFQVLIRHRRRRRPHGVLGLSDAAVVLLSGFKPDGAAGRLRIEEISAPEILDRVWAVFLTVSCDAAVVPYADPEHGARLARAMFENVETGATNCVENSA